MPQGRYSAKDVQSSPTVGRYKPSDVGRPAFLPQAPKSEEDIMLEEAPFSERFSEGFGGIPTSKEDASKLQKKLALDGLINVLTEGVGKTIWDMGSNAATQFKSGVGTQRDTIHDTVSDLKGARNLTDRLAALKRGAVKSLVAGSETELKMLPGGEQLWNMGEDFQSGRYMGALGGGTAFLLQAMLMDALMGKSGPLKSRQRIAQLTRASKSVGGGFGDVGAHIEKVEPEITQAAKEYLYTNNKKPSIWTGKTNLELKDWQGIADNAERKVNNDFNMRLQSLGNRKYLPIKVAQRLMQAARELPKTAVQERAAYVEAAKKYMGPTDVIELNKERMFANDKANSFYNKDSQAQVSAQKGGQSGALYQTEADAIRDVLYEDIIDPAFPNDEPTRVMKQKHQSLGAIRSRIREVSPEVRSQQYGEEGAPLAERMSPSGTFHPSGMGVRMHAPLRSVLPEVFGPEKQANRAVTKAFQGLEGEALKASQVTPKKPPTGTTTPQRPAFLPKNPKGPTRPTGSTGPRPNVPSQPFEEGLTPEGAGISHEEENRGQHIIIDKDGNNKGSLGKKPDVSSRSPQATKGTAVVELHPDGTIKRVVSNDTGLSDMQLQEKNSAKVAKAMNEGKAQSKSILPNQVRVNVEGEDRVVTLSPEKMKEWNAAKSNYEAAIQRSKNFSPEQRAAQQKAAGFRFAAEKRRITGELTGVERRNAARHEATNYKGKSVTVQGKRGEVVGTAFGKITVKLQDGSTVRVNPEEISK